MAEVDPARMVVRSPTAVFAFEADCGRGTAIFDATGAPVPLQLMRWGEKCGLARFAELGPAFVEDQILRLCAAPAADAERREALLSLILWLHAPLEPPLPFDERLLARVTLELCHALDGPPAVIAEMSAPTVEALWRALPAAADQARATDPDVTRIVVVPDRAPMPSASPSTSPSAAKGRTSGLAAAVAPAVPRAEPQPAAIAEPASEDRQGRESLLLSAGSQRRLREATPRFALRHAGRATVAPVVPPQASATTATDAPTTPSAGRLAGAPERSCEPRLRRAGAAVRRPVGRQAGSPEPATGSRRIRRPAGSR